MEDLIVIKIIALLMNKIQGKQGKTFLNIINIASCIMIKLFCISSEIYNPNFCNVFYFPTNITTKFEYIK